MNDEDMIRKKWQAGKSPSDSLRSSLLVEPKMLKRTSDSPVVVPKMDMLGAAAKVRYIESKADLI
jgi:hypothetical protein